MSDYFDFRIVKSEDGTEIIEPHVITLCSSLTSKNLIEYMEMDNQIAYMDRMMKRKRREKKQRHIFMKNQLFSFVR